MPPSSWFLTCSGASRVRCHLPDIWNLTKILVRAEYKLSTLRTPSCSHFQANTREQFESTKTGTPFLSNEILLLSISNCPQQQGKFHCPLSGAVQQVRFHCNVRKKEQNWNLLLDNLGKRVSEFLVTITLFTCEAQFRETAVCRMRGCQSVCQPPGPESAERTHV